jgi:hypothetical protein
MEVCMLTFSLHALVTPLTQMIQSTNLWLLLEKHTVRMCSWAFLCTFYVSNQGMTKQIKIKEIFHFIDFSYYNILAQDKNGQKEEFIGELQRF